MTIFDSTAFLASVFMLVLCVGICFTSQSYDRSDVVAAVVASLLGCFAFFGMLVCWFWPIIGKLV